MPITVDKSPLIEFDSHTENALASTLSSLEKQSDLVKSVTLLANFSIDKLATLQHGATILQGLVVQVAPEYTLGTSDMAWFHPDIAAGRSVFDVDTFIPKSSLSSLELDGLQSSVGSYTTSKPDEFGCETVQHHIVVDTTISEMVGSLYNKWIQTGVTAGDVVKQWKRMQFGDTYGIKQTAMEVRSQIAKKVSADCREIYSDTTNDVLSDSSSVYFTNNVVKSDDARILVKSSSLGGYRMYTASNKSIRFYPSSLGSANDYYSFSSMSPKNCARIEKACAWKGNLEFNAMVMTGPAIAGTKIRSLEDAYEISFRDSFSMNTAAFSPSDSIHDSMNPQELYAIHPNNSRNSKAYITAPVDMDHPVLQHIMKNLNQIQQAWPEFQIFNPKIVENGRIKVPKQIFKQID